MPLPSPIWRTTALLLLLPPLPSLVSRIPLILDIRASAVVVVVVGAAAAVVVAMKTAIPWPW